MIRKGKKREVGEMILDLFVFALFVAGGFVESYRLWNDNHAIDYFQNVTPERGPFGSKPDK